jgi:CRP-like cAMP-binding protein
MKEITFNKDQVVFRQGDNASVMYDIISGKIGIYSDYQTENEKLLAELGSDAVFGEMGMIEFYPRSATAVALEDGTVLQELDEADLRTYFADKPDKLLKLMQQLSARIRETTQAYVDVCRSVSERRRAESEKNLAEQLRFEQEMFNYASLYTANWM